MKKILTIGICVYDNQPFIEELLYTINEQIRSGAANLEEVEFVLTDDSSQNRTYQELIPSFFTVLNNTQNQGTPAAGRNQIIAMSKSKYLLFIDGDDQLLANINDIINELKRKEEDILVSEVSKIDQDGNKLYAPFIYNKELFTKNMNPNIISKLIVHQTGIWSIYRVSFLQQQQIRYRTDIRYEDNYFLFDILLRNPKIGVSHVKYYGWRNNFNSFSYTENNYSHRAKMYREVLEKLLKPNLQMEIAPYIYYSMWNQTYMNLIRNYQKFSKNERNENFQLLESVSQHYRPEIKNLYSRVDYSVTKKLFKQSKYPMVQNKYIWNLLERLNKVHKNTEQLKKKAMKLFCLLPINSNKVFFMSHYGQYNDNPKYMYLELKEKFPDKKFVFPVKNKKLAQQQDFIQYDNRFLFYYHLYTAKTFYFNTWLEPSLKKRKKQEWYQLWHGYPYKKMYKDITIYNQTNSLAKTKNKERNIAKWDYIYSLDKDNTERFSMLFPNVKIIEKLYPRIKWLLKNANNSELKAEIYQKYKIDPNQKYTLYAPTYRPYHVTLNSTEIMEQVGSDNVVLFNPHPMMNYSFGHTPKINEITQVEGFDIQEILLITDELITDYSSIAYDFKILMNFKNKLVSIKYYCPDDKLYRKINGVY